MIQWLLVEGDSRAFVRRAAATVWGGGAVCQKLLPLGRATLTATWPDGARPQRPPCWPELLADWHEFHSDVALFPDQLLPVLGEATSAAGQRALLLFVGAGGLEAVVAWYEKGVVCEYERVGGTAVAWYPDSGLGQPRRGGVAGKALSLAKKQADSPSDEGLFGRIEGSHAAAVAEIYQRALCRLAGGGQPPTFENLAAIAARAGGERWPFQGGG